MNVPAHHVPGFDAAKNPGDFWITPPNPVEGGDRRLTFVCPCGCGSIGGIMVRDDGQQIDGAWAWDRNEDCPTTTPSIRFLSGCQWHGYLTAGVFIPC